jgi:hypothetical protein
MINTRPPTFPPAGPLVRISQQGIIPATAVGIELFGSAFGRVLVNGEDIGNTYDGHVNPLDISRFAGQEVILEFLFQPGASGNFDIYGFTQVPEPSTGVLFGIGVMAVAWAARHHRRP